MRTKTEQFTALFSERINRVSVWGLLLLAVTRLQVYFRKTCRHQQT